MLQRTLISLALIALPLCATAAPTPATINVGGVTRDYIIDGPKGAGPKPTILVLHGLNGTAQQLASSHFPVFGEQNGFVSVFLQGIGKRWNHFPAGQVPPSYITDWQQAGSNSPPDDVGFIKTLVADLVAHNIADPKRVYLFGFSAGGFMSMRMVCEDDTIFAAVALISSSMPVPAGAVCHPKMPIPLYTLRGTGDDHQHYNGGTVLDGTFAVWGEDKLIDFFTQLDNCDGQGSAITVAGANPAKESFLQYNCAHGPMIMGTVQGGQHILYPLPPPPKTLWWFFQPLHR